MLELTFYRRSVAAAAPKIKRYALAVGATPAPGLTPVPQEFAAEMGEQGFAVRMHTSDLLAYGICPGDFLLCRRQTTASPGQLVAIPAQIFDGMCIRVYPARGDTLLLPEGTQDPIALAAPPRSKRDVCAVVIGVDRPHQTFHIGVPYARRPRPAVTGV